LWRVRSSILYNTPRHNFYSDNPLFDAIYPDTATGGFDEPATCGAFKPANVISISYGGDEPGKSLHQSSFPLLNSF
jgi:hypothetical protein